LLEGSTRIVDPDPSCRMWRLKTLWRHDFDVIISSDVISDVTNRRAVGNFLQGPFYTCMHEPAIRSEIFSIKVAVKETDRHTQRHTNTSTGNKGRLKLAAREPTLVYACRI